LLGCHWHPASAEVRTRSALLTGKMPVAPNQPHKKRPAAPTLPNVEAAKPTADPEHLPPIARRTANIQQQATSIKGPTAPPPFRDLKSQI
jgi:hypothetical protein